MAEESNLNRMSNPDEVYLVSTCMVCAGLPKDLLQQMLPCLNCGGTEEVLYKLVKGALVRVRDRGGLNR